MLGKSPIRGKMGKTFRLPKHYKFYNRCQSFLWAIKSLTMLHSGATGALATGQRRDRG